ncbi:hypothetical protein Acy02nite_17230 [Actinoplanes cyaneus]|uniref:ANTAR domain-containing protein n=1 Tax=Actinoplanes cyaneus TaxID=52696 RepID=A0A919IGC0_9ACTN|nr:hypothetical protein Acy02nite_17230 [Actinoplanes cyaneus]
MQGPLAAALETLAGTPDDQPTIDEQLNTVAQLAADRVIGIDYASITAFRNDAYVTMAASSELALAVDEAQYADDDGPCMQSLRDAAPVTVKDIAATMSWPGFRKAAENMGLHASVSIPLTAGSGKTIAVLNLYARDADSVAPLIAGLAIIYDPARTRPYEVPASVAAGADELLAGCAAALSVHATIQRAVGIIMARTRCEAADAYATLRIEAADAGVALPSAAAGIIQQAGNRD